MAICTGKRFDLKSEEPSRDESTETDDVKKAYQQSGMDILYQERLHVHLECEKHLRENEKKAYSLVIRNYCTKQMRTRIEEHPDYAMSILDNPIELLEKSNVDT